MAGAGPRFAVVSKDEKGGKFHLSVICPVKISVCENLNLDLFQGNYDVLVGSCEGLLCFQGDKGNIAICNLRTKEMKILPPPPYLSSRDDGGLISGGLGYDANSGDLKVIRHYVDYTGLDIGLVYELYSLKNGQWKEIDDSLGRACIYGGAGLYLGETGSCYWAGTVDFFAQEIKDYLESYSITDNWAKHVVSFDFATDSFGLFPLPATSTTTGKSWDPKALFKLVEWRGSLGALNYLNSSVFVEVFVRRGRSWDFLYAVTLGDVQKPLGVIDDRWLFFEAKASDGGQLMIYDLYTGESNELDIYDYRGRMSGISYGAETIHPPLPGSIRVTNYCNSNGKSTKGKGKGKSTKGKAKGKKGKGRR